METERTCPNCRKPLPPDVALGLCPECLIKAGFPSGTEADIGASARFVPPTVEEIAKLFPQLEIVGFIGKGGMGAVYKARQTALDRLVALKVLPPVVGNVPSFAERFNREARALAHLNHPNIVAVHDFGKAGSLYYLLMEFVDGANLREIEQAGRLSPEQVLTIIPQICNALQFAHNEGIVHRDIKPENILLDKKGQLKITDFGIAKILNVQAGKASLTGPKDVVGTPHYMAPEQIERSQTVDHRADIYSLGVVFYEMLTGELPLGKFQPPSQKVHIDVRLDEVVLRALEKEPERRYQQASEVKMQVETIATTPAQGMGTSISLEAFTNAAMARDYSLNITHCLNRAWNLVISDFWPIIGVTGLVWFLQRVADSTLIGIVVGGPLSGGMWLYFLKKIRGQPADAKTIFSGFSGVAFIPLLLGGLVTMLLILVGFICFILPAIYLTVAWAFALILIADKGFDFWPAMDLSRKIISKHWGKFFLFLIVLGLIYVAGFFALIFGFLVTGPIAIAALAYSYEDLFAPTEAMDEESAR